MASADSFTDFESLACERPSRLETGGRTAIANAPSHPENPRRHDTCPLPLYRFIRKEIAMLPQPDPGRHAPRPSQHPDDEPRPDMDHPPKAHRGDLPAFDRGTAAADDDARAGGLTSPGNPTPPDDIARTHPPDRRAPVKRERS